MEKILFNEEDMPEIKLPGRTVRWLMNSDNSASKYAAACSVVYEPGKRAVPAHSHPNGEEVVYVVSGTGKVLIGDEIADIKPGSIFLFPQGVPHAMYNTGDEELKGICFYSPSPEATTYEFHEDVDFPEFK